MRRFFYFLNTKLTIGLLISTFCTFVFAFMVNCSCEYWFESFPVKGGLGLLDISYFGILVAFRFLFATVLEYLLQDNFYLPLSNFISKPNITALMMDADTPQGSSDNKQGSSDNNQDSSSKKSSGLNEGHKVGDDM